MMQANYGPSPSFGAQSPAFVRDLTDADLSSHLGTVSSSGGIYVQFFYAKIRIENPENAAINGTYQTRLCVAKQPRGDRHTIAVQYVTPDQAMQQWPREYAAFSQSEAIPTTGTPLHELPGLSMSQMSLLALHNLRCVEDVVACPMEHINQMGMDAISARHLAQRWTDSKAQNADMIKASQTDAATATELDRLRKAEAAQSKLVTELSAKIDVLMRMGGQPAMQGQAASPQVMMIDAPDSPDLPVGPSRMFEGGVAAMGNDDLLADDPVHPDPLDLKTSKRR